MSAVCWQVGERFFFPHRTLTTHASNVLFNFVFVTSQKNIQMFKQIRQNKQNSLVGNRSRGMMFHVSDEPHHLRLRKLRVLGRGAGGRPRDAGWRLQRQAPPHPRRREKGAACGLDHGGRIQAWLSDRQIVISDQWCPQKKDKYTQPLFGTLSVLMTKGFMNRVNRSKCDESCSWFHWTAKCPENNEQRMRHRVHSNLPY